MTDCKCVCVRKRKKKKTMPKPVKQQALIDRYNTQTPLINLPAYQTTFREPMKRKKYSVYKAPIIAVKADAPKSKILTPLMKPPLPKSKIESTRLKRESAESRLQQTIDEMDRQSRPTLSTMTPAEEFLQVTPTQTERVIDRRRPQPSEARPFQRVSGRPGRQIASTVSRTVFADTGAGAGAMDIPK